MIRKILLAALTLTLLFSFSPTDCWGRGGRGGRGGGAPGGGGFHGGGFSGGASRGGAGGIRSPGGFGGAGAGANSRSLGNSTNLGAPGAGAGGARVGGNAGFAGQRPGQAPRGTEHGGFNRPTNNQLSNFLGMPSDEGMHHLGATQRTSPGQRSAEGQFDVNYGTKEGPHGGEGAGVAVTGPQGNTAGRVVGVGPEGGVAKVGGVQGADGGAAARGAAVGPGGRVVAGRGAVGPDGRAAAGGLVAGPGGVAAGFTRVTPSGRYTTAAAVRTNYNHWGVYGRGWYANYPGAWFAAGWAAGSAWNTCTWDTAAAYSGYTDMAPVEYDYGNNVTYDDQQVYVNGESAGTAEQYYDQAMDLASTGAAAEAPSDSDWLPLGVFALTKPEQPKSDVSIQLAVNKEGTIRGNYTDTATNKNQVVQGSVDKQTQRVAFTVGDHSKDVVETGLYNLTKDEAPCLIHFGNERTEQWLLVRLQQPDTATK